jgi:hypothetical protein
VADADFDRVDALGDERRRDLHVVFDAQALPKRQQIVAVALQQQREARAHPPARLTHDLAHDPEPVLEGAAVGVPPSVGMRRQELRQEIAVGRMDLDAVESGRLAAHGGRREGVDDSGQLVEAQRPRLRAHHRLAHGRSGDGLVDAGMAEDQLATAVGELGDQLRPVAMAGAREAGETRDPIVAVGGAHAIGALAFRRDVEVAGDDEWDPAAGEGLVPVDELVADEAVLGRPRLGGRRLEEAARDLEGAEPDWIEERR